MNEVEGLASGKRRSFSQRVGSGGELAFRNLSHRQGLISTKVEEDFGVDFTCQVDLDRLSRKSSGIASAIIGACVRATASEAGTVYVYPGDAANLLNARTPLVFVLVHLDGDPAKAPIYHRRVDEPFMIELREFLDSGASRMSLAPDKCRPEDEFEASLREMLSYGFIERTRLAVAEAGLNTMLPEASVEIRSGSGGQLTLVSTIDYFSLFERIDADQEGELLHAAFGADEHVKERIAQLNPRPKVIDYLKSLPQPMVFTGYSTEAEVRLRVVLSGQTAIEPFTYRAIGTHFGYVHAAGISLIVSRARDHNGTMVHETEVYIDPLTMNVMDDLGSTVDFFALCGPGARLHDADEVATAGGGFEVAEMFAPLQSAAAMIRAWRTCADIEGWPARSVELKHFTNAETFNTMVGFAHLIDEPESISSASVTWSTNPDQPELNSLEPTPTTFLVPVIGNLVEYTVVLHLTVAGATLSTEGQVVGAKFDSVVSAKCEVRNRAAKTTPYPELVLGGGTDLTCSLGHRAEGSLPQTLSDLSLGWAAEKDSK